MWMSVFVVMEAVNKDVSMIMVHIIVNANQDLFNTVTDLSA